MEKNSLGKFSMELNPEDYTLEQFMFIACLYCRFNGRLTHDLRYRKVNQTVEELRNCGRCEQDLKNLYEKGEKFTHTVFT